MGKDKPDKDKYKGKGKGRSEPGKDKSKAEKNETPTINENFMEIQGKLKYNPYLIRGTTDQVSILIKHKNKANLVHWVKGVVYQTTGLENDWLVIDKNGERQERNRFYQDTKDLSGSFLQHVKKQINEEQFVLFGYAITNDQEDYGNYRVQATTQQPGTGGYRHFTNHALRFCIERLKQTRPDTNQHKVLTQLSQDIRLIRAREKKVEDIRPGRGYGCIQIFPRYMIYTEAVKMRDEFLKAHKNLTREQQQEFKVSQFFDTTSQYLSQRQKFINEIKKKCEQENEDQLFIMKEEVNQLVKIRQNQIQQELTDITHQTGKRQFPIAEEYNGLPGAVVAKLLEQVLRGRVYDIDQTHLRKAYMEGTARLRKQGKEVVNTKPNVFTNPEERKFDNSASVATGPPTLKPREYRLYNTRPYIPVMAEKDERQQIDSRSEPYQEGAAPYENERRYEAEQDMGTNFSQEANLRRRQTFDRGYADQRQWQHPGHFQGMQREDYERYAQHPPYEGYQQTEENNDYGHGDMGMVRPQHSQQFSPNINQGYNNQGYNTGSFYGQTDRNYNWNQVPMGGAPQVQMQNQTQNTSTPQGLDLNTKAFMPAYGQKPIQGQATQNTSHENNKMKDGQSFWRGPDLFPPTKQNDDT